MVVSAGGADIRIARFLTIPASPSIKICTLAYYFPRPGLL